MTAPGEPRRLLLTSSGQPWLAELKTQILDPALRERGMDPDRYELAFELDGPPLVPPPPPLTDQQELARAATLQTIAAGLDIPPEILEAVPNHWDPWRQAGPTAETGDPYDIGAFERTRSRYMPRWRYVSGGKALHAFIDGSDRPACGIDPRRGRDRHPARWIEVSTRGLLGNRLQRRHKHGPCAGAVRAHRDAMLRGGAG